MGQLDTSKNPWELNLASSTSDQEKTLYTAGTVVDRDIKVSVSKMPTEEKTVTPSTDAQTITPTAGKLISKVTVNAVSASTAQSTLGSATLAASGTASATTTVAPGNVTIAANTTDLSGKTRIASTPSTSTPSTAYYIAAKANAAANTTGTTSSITGTASASTTKSGYAEKNVTTGTGSITGTATAKTSSKDSSVYYFPVAAATASKTDATASASVSKNPSASASVTPTGITTSDTATSYYVTASASAASGTATASVTASSASITAGYASSGVSTSTAAKSATTTEATASDSKTVYIKAATTGTSNSGTNVSTVAPGKSTQYVNITEGYTPAKKWTIGAVSADTAKSILGNASIGNATAVPDGYSENTSVTVPSQGYLKINAGYIGNTVISLDQMLDGKTDTAGTAEGNILTGKIAYDVDGKKLTGTMTNNPRVGLTSEVGTTTNTEIPGDDTYVYYRLAEGYYPNTAWRGTPLATFGDAAASEVLSGKTFTSTAGLKVSGTMPTVSPSTTTDTNTATTLNAGTKLKIPAGYHANTTYYVAQAASDTAKATVSANSPTITPSIASTATDGAYAITGSATTSVSVGKAGYISSSTGTKNTGTASISGSVAESTLSADSVTPNVSSDQTVIIGAGYYPSDRTVTVKGMSSGTEATFTNVTTTTGDDFVEIVSDAGYTGTKKISALTVPASKTLSSLTLTSGTSTNKTSLSNLIAIGNSYVNNIVLASGGYVGNIGLNTADTYINNIYGDGYIKTSGGGALGKFTHNGTLTTLDGSGDITNYTNTGTITNMGGARTISNLGYKDANDYVINGRITVSDNSYGTINVNGGGSVDQGATIRGKVVTVDGGTAVTDWKGDLITTSLTNISGGTASLTGTSNTITLGANRFVTTTNVTDFSIAAAAKAKATRTAVTYKNTAGWLSAHSAAETVSAANTSSESTINATTKYISGVNLRRGGSTFTINDGIYTWTWSVDSSGNVTID